MADEKKNHHEEHEQEEQDLHTQVTVHAVKLVDKAYTDIAEQLQPEMEAWLKKLAETHPEAKDLGSDDLRTNVEGAVLIAMLAVSNALLRTMPPERALMYAVSAHHLSHRLMPSSRAELPDVPDTFPQSGTGRA